MTWEVRQGDALTELCKLEPESVQTVVTSPPYWGLRDYGSEGQLGLEPTPEQYVENMVEVFREVRRVLRDDGTVWLNLGDSYAASTKGDTRSADELAVRSGLKRNVAEDRRQSTIARNKQYRAEGRHRLALGNLKPKDLCGIPWRVAFALQADGWWLRSDIIWSKPNPMPESVRDRPTRSHEYVFLLTKSARYFFDQEAVREPHETPLHAPGNKAKRYDAPNSDHHWEPERMDKVWGDPSGRNIRSVWNIATQPFPEAHFATFPEKLVEPCILAGSRERVDDPVKRLGAYSGSVVLDPFCGSGTVGAVALRHNRDFLGLELNPSYCEMARNRIRDDAPLLNTHLEAA